jgi:hypothetical protein
MSRWFAQRAVLLASQLGPGEHELARGRMQELSHMDINRPSMIDTGSASHVLIVTQERMLWMLEKPQWVTSLPFSSVTRWTEMAQAHRCAMVLEHRDITRLQWVPAHRFLWWEWGDSEAYRLRNRSILGFSHTDTKAARAIRERLAAQGLPTRSPIIWPHETSDGYEFQHKPLRLTGLRPLRRRRPRASRWRGRRRPP